MSSHRVYLITSLVSQNVPHYTTIFLYGCLTNCIEFDIPSGLSKYTTYNVIVQAYNSRGSGPASSSITARTLEDAPTLPPENVQCSVQSAQSLHVSWEPPLQEGRNGDIKGYKVTHHSVSDWIGIMIFYCNSYFRT